MVRNVLAPNEDFVPPTLFKHWLPINSPIADLNCSPRLHNWLVYNAALTTVGDIISAFNVLCTTSDLGPILSAELVARLQAKALATERLLQSTPSERASGNYIETELVTLFALVRLRMDDSCNREIQRLRQRNQLRTSNAH